MPYLVTKFFCLFLYYQRLQTLQVNGQKDFWTIDVRISLIDFTKLQQKSEMRKDIVIELSYKGFG